MSGRQSTPPNVAPASLPLTPEQIRRVEINRLMAKARLRESESSASSSSAPNAHKKRPLQVTPAASTSPTAPAPLKRNNRLGNYFEYDLSKMVNSKGGFLVEDNDKSDERTRMLEQQRAEQRTAQKLDPRGCEIARLPCLARLSIDLRSNLSRSVFEPQMPGMWVCGYRPLVQENIWMFGLREMQGSQAREVQFTHKD